MRVLFDGGLLEHVPPKRSAKVLTMLLRALVECNLDYLEQNPDTPHPYKAGIKYLREKKTEQWMSVATKNRVIPAVSSVGVRSGSDLA